MNEFEKHVSRENFTADAKERTKKILDIIAGEGIQELVAKAKAGDEKASALVVSNFAAGQAAVFQALHINVAKLHAVGMIDAPRAKSLVQTIDSMSVDVMQSITERSSLTGDNVVPFSTKVR